MKQRLLKSILGTYLIAFSFVAYSQTGGVSINNTNAPAHPSSILDVSSPSSPYLGMLIPRMSTANRNAISAPATGLQIFNTDCGVNEYYTGTCWISTGQNLKTPGTISCSGTTDFCANESRTFTIAPITGATSYTWTAPAGATISSGQGTTTASVIFGNNSGDVYVRAENACESSANSFLSIHINPVPPAPGNITGPTTVIPGTSANYFIAAVTGAGVYNWTVPSGATITSGVGTTTITVNFPCGTASGNISVAAQSNCGTSASTSLAITMSSLTANAGGPLVLTPGALGGSPTASAGAGSYSYAWVPSTALSSTTLANPTSTACSPITYTVTVTDANGCTASSSTTASPGNPVSANAGPTMTPPGALGGSPTATAGTPPYTYAWIPSTDLSSTTASNPTTIVCTTTTYSVTVTDANGCSASSSVIASVTNPIPATPGAITGNSSVCGNSVGNVYSINSVAGATTYTWSVPSGASITGGQGTTSATVTFGSSSGNVSVTAGNSCGNSSASTYAITVNVCSQTFNATSTGPNGTIQNFTVPSAITSITIEAWGAQAGTDTYNSRAGGKGAYMKGTFTVAPGDVLKVLVGQMGGNSAFGAGGGGGSFVATNANSPLLVAGGGGGTGNEGSFPGIDASTSTSGNNGTVDSPTGFGGTNGNGGSAGRLTPGGGGFYTDGSPSASDGPNAVAGPGRAFVNGGAGGASSPTFAGCNPGSWTSAPGGFGGGGGAGYAAAGAGGGYSGGGGAGGCKGSGGGAGSYNGGTNQTNTAGVQTGAGMVTISW